jgi:hypothetical protein
MSERALATAQKQSSAAPSHGAILQRKCACGNHTMAGGECESCKGKKGLLQRKSANAGAVGVVPPIVHDVLHSPSQPLDRGTRAFFEQRFERDLSEVRVHTDPLAIRSARAVNALAYTVGRDLVFSESQYAPQSHKGRGLLAHELTHFVQQGSGTPQLDTFVLDPLGTSPHEQEAERIRGAIESGGNAGEIRQRTDRGIQRLPGSDAGGCGVCYGTPKAAGIAAHEEIQTAFGPRFHPEFSLPPSVTDDNGRLDLAILTGRNTVDIGEIKPANPAGLIQGDLDLFWYEDQLTKLGFRVRRLTLPPPIASISFPSLAPPPCPPTQQLFVDPPAHGIYTYWCTPDFKELIPKCPCRKQQPEGERNRERVPVPLSPPQTAPNPQVQRPPEDLRPPVEGPAPTPTVRPEPGTPPAPEHDGDKVIPLRKPKPKPTKEEQPEEHPEEVPLAAKEKLSWKELIWVAAVLALTVIGKKVLETVAKGPKGNPILLLIQLAAVAAILVLRERQAKAGERQADDDPLVAFAQMLDDTGRKMPPEIRKLLEDNPELRELVRLEVERRRREGAAHAPDGTQGKPGSDSKVADGSKTTETPPQASVGDQPGQVPAATKPQEGGGPTVEITKDSAASVDKKVLDVADESLKKFEWLNKGQQQIPLPNAADEYVVGKTYDLGLAGRDAQGVLYLGIIKMKIVAKKGNQWTVTILAGAKLYTYGHLYGATRQTTSSFTYSAKAPESKAGNTQ